MKSVISIINNEPCIVDDLWFLGKGCIGEAASVDENDLARSLSSYEIVPVNQLQSILTVNLIELSKQGLLLEPEDDPAVLVPWLEHIGLVALKFETFKDGRAYTQANLLRTRYEYKGEIRAIGDVLRDQLAAMRHCGFSSFVVRQDKSVTEALKGLSGFDMIYARSVYKPEPLFRRRKESLSLWGK